MCRCWNLYGNDVLKQIVNILLLTVALQSHARQNVFMPFRLDSGFLSADDRQALKDILVSKLR